MANRIHALVSATCWQPLFWSVPASPYSELARQDKQSRCRNGGWTWPRCPTPAYAKDSGAVILYDEYLETVDAQGRAVEREREAMRILQAAGPPHCLQMSATTWTRRSTTSGSGPLPRTESNSRPRTRTLRRRVRTTGIPNDMHSPDAKIRVVHPPAADVGATLICESEELMAPYMQEKDWQIQSGIPIVFRGA